MSYDDELPVASFPHAYQGRGGPEMQPVDISASRDVQSKLDRDWQPYLLPQNLLPWADLNGNQKESLLSPAKQNGAGSAEPLSPISREAQLFRQRSRDNSSPSRSLLPFSNGSTGSTFNSLPKPKFLSGIPTKAYAYTPDTTDPIDVELHRSLRDLNQEASVLLALRFVTSGRYEIDGRDVQLYWDGEGASRRLMVHEDEVGGPSIADMPLPAYIDVVANIATDLQRPAVSAPVLTFAQTGAYKTSDAGRLAGEDRFRAMNIACTQAKLREEEAERQCSGSVAGSLRRNCSSPRTHY